MQWYILVTEPFVFERLRCRPCCPKIPSGTDCCYPKIHSGSDLCYRNILSAVLLITSRHDGVLPTLYRLSSVYRHNHLTTLRSITKQVILTVGFWFAQLYACVQLTGTACFGQKFSDHHQGTLMLEGSVVTFLL